jgi:DNA-binding transcriptional MerR regulator
MKKKNLINGLILSFLFIFSLSGLLAEDMQDQEEGPPVFSETTIASSEDLTVTEEINEYAPGQLIVKLKDGATLEDIAELNQKYNVTSVEKVFKDTPSAQEVLEELKQKLKGLEAEEHKGWYWQLDKDSEEYKEYIARIEKEKEELEMKIAWKEKLIAKLEQRQERTVEDATTSNLDNIYLLETTQETDIPTMAEEYADNPAVE